MKPVCSESHLLTEGWGAGSQEQTHSPGTGLFQPQHRPTAPQRGEQGRPKDQAQVQQIVQIFRRIHGDEAGLKLIWEINVHVRASFGAIVSKKNQIEPCDHQEGP